MPNFDAFERQLRAALCDPEAALEAGQALAGLPDRQRPEFARGHSAAELSEWLQRALDALQADYPGETFATDARNRLGRDLTASPSEAQIELKSDERTDANLGISTIAWAMDEEPEELQTIFTTGKLERRTLALGDPGILSNDPRIVDSKRRECARHLAYFADRLKLGAEVPVRFRHLIHCVGLGITTLERMIRAQDALPDDAVIYAADWVSGLRPYSIAYEPGESFVVRDLRRADMGESGPGRLSIRLEGTVSRRTFLLYPHYKNSWRPRHGARIEAANWVQTPCFHAWVDG